MQNDLKIVELYNSSNSEKITKFNASLNSNFSISSNYEKVEADFAWLDIMEDTINYIDNILRNPNRFIVNEEEIVKVEQAKRITVESIKHLSKHTNFIQEIEDNGDVRPSKILNINKDESYNTYENRLIYTLINNMKLFIEMKTRNLVTSSRLKDLKKCEYSGTTKIGVEKVAINMSISSKTNYDKEDGIRNGMTVEQRIERLKLRISDLTNLPVYVSLAKEHVARVIPPIKKTNLILKNVNFQYAMKLWDFIQENASFDDSIVKYDKVVDKDVKIKQMLDDTFLLNYLTMSSIDENGSEMSVEAKTELVEDITNKMINKIVELNVDLPLEKLQESISDKIAVIKSKNEATLSEVERRFNENLEAFINKILDFDFR